jgi:hypothetical protein
MYFKVISVPTQIEIIGFWLKIVVSLDEIKFLFLLFEDSPSSFADGEC